jgi:hypothetical protein
MFRWRKSPSSGGPLMWNSLSHPYGQGREHLNVYSQIHCVTFQTKKFSTFNSSSSASALYI